MANPNEQSNQTTDQTVNQAPIQSPEEAAELQARVDQAQAAYPDEASRPEATTEFLKVAEEKLNAWNSEQNTVIAREVNVESPPE